MYNHNKAQQSKNRVHISWDILYAADLWYGLNPACYFLPFNSSYIPVVWITMLSSWYTYVSNLSQSKQNQYICTRLKYSYLLTQIFRYRATLRDAAYLDLYCYKTPVAWSFTAIIFHVIVLRVHNIFKFKQPKRICLVKVKPGWSR